MIPIDTILTARLAGERIRAGDFAELCRMHRDPAVMATLGGVRSDEQTWRFLEGSLDHWERHGHGLWMFRDREGGRFVGRGGLRRMVVGGSDEVEVSYALRSEWWGRGLATEIARASVAVGFERLGLPDLVCFTLVTNRASRRVMEKAGFLCERDVEHAGLPHVLYRLRNPGPRGREA